MYTHIHIYAHIYTYIHTYHTYNLITKGESLRMEAVILMAVTCSDRIIGSVQSTAIMTDL